MMPGLLTTQPVTRQLPIKYLYVVTGSVDNSGCQNQEMPCTFLQILSVGVTLQKQPTGEKEQQLKAVHELHIQHMTRLIKT